MGFLRSGGKQARLLFAAMLVMIGMTALAAPVAAFDGPAPGVLLQVDDEPAATPTDPGDGADDAADDDGSVAALPETGNGSSQNDGASPYLIGAVGLVSVVAVGFLGLRLVGRRL